MTSTRTFRLLLLAPWVVAIYARSSMTSIRCVLFQKCVTFGPTAEHPRGYHRDYWACKLSNVDSEKFDGLQFVEFAESSSSSSSLKGILANATSGSSVLSISEATIDDDAALLHIPAHANIQIQDEADADAINNNNNNNNSINVRNLANAKSTGTLNTLVIRVIDSNGIEPTSSTDQLIDDVFADAISLKTQMEACSYNKLRIEPFHGTTPTNHTIQNGVVDIQMDFDITSNTSGVDNAALRAAKDTLGDLDDPMFDLVMICMPPGPANDFLAFAFNNSKYSFYNDEWCGYVDAQMHEVGHNLGLAHSGEVGEGEYGDKSGLMGVSSGEDDYRQCYNPQKSYQLGWYDDQTWSIDPLAADSSDKLPLDFTLNGVADYGNNPDALVVLRLAQENHHQDYYIGYNRATGIHADTTEDADHVTVVRKDFGSPKAYGQSTKMASLWVGQNFVLRDFNGSGQDITVFFSGVTEDGDARVTILAGDDAELPVPLPGNCQTFTVEVHTDGYPEDNSWYILDTTDEWGRVWATSEVFDASYNLYRQEVCLPKGPTAKTYKFAIEDKYGDGIGFGTDGGEEGYKILSEDGSLLVEGRSNFAADRKWVYHILQVDNDPQYQPTAPPTQSPGAVAAPLDVVDDSNNNDETDAAPVLTSTTTTGPRKTGKNKSKITKTGKRGKATSTRR